jgi:hypothetical protein
MARRTVSFNDGDVQELNEIIMYKDKDGALKLLKEKAKLNVQGKRHL